MLIRNLGSTDRLVRIAIAGGLVLIAATVPGSIGTWGWIGLLPLATALVGVCPVYLTFGLNTSRKAKSGSNQ